MKKISTWSLMGYAVGAVICFMSALRYFTIWIDYSQGTIFIFVGLCIMAFSWIYNELLKLNNTVIAVEDFLAEKTNENSM